MEMDHMRPSGKQASRKILCDKAGTALLCFLLNTKFLEVEKEKPNLKSMITEKGWI
jgi:hypothetical protein